MKEIIKDTFLKKSVETLDDMVETLRGLPSAKIGGFESCKTALVVVDMINGFANEGALKSDRIKELIPYTVKLIKLCNKQGIKGVAFSDSHSEGCPEFENYPRHCIAGTSESRLIREIEEAGEMELIRKNSTNGFLEEGFSRWLDENSEVENFILAGDCTDICILQFALTLKAYFNIRDKKVTVTVPMDVVDTYDLGTHNGDLMNVFSLCSMIGNGIQVVKTIEE